MGHNEPCLRTMVESKYVMVEENPADGGRGNFATVEPGIENCPSGAKVSLGKKNGHASTKNFLSKGGKIRPFGTLTHRLSPYSNGR
jgi:hypothetical protein